MTTSPFQSDFIHSDHRSQNKPCEKWYRIARGGRSRQQQAEHKRQLPRNIAPMSREPAGRAAARADAQTSARRAFRAETAPAQEKCRADRLRRRRAKTHGRSRNSGRRPPYRRTKTFNAENGRNQQKTKIRRSRQQQKRKTIGARDAHNSGSKPPYSVPPAPLLLKNERTGFDGSGSAALAPKQQPIT